MRILFVAERYPPVLGGVATSAGRISRALARRGHDLHVFVQARELPGGMVHSERLPERLTLHRFGPAKSIDFTIQQSLLFLEWLHNRTRFDLVWGHYLTSAGFLATWFAKNQAIPVVVSARGNDLDKQLFPPGDFARLQWTLERATSIVAVSRELAHKVKVLCDRTAEVLPNSVDTDLFTPGPRPDELAQRFGFRPGELVLGYCGELRAKKGMAFLVQAFRTLAARQPTRLFIIGQVRGEDRGELERSLVDSQLGTQLTVTGHLTSPELVCQHLRLADLTLIPSLWDGMPNSLLESMAAGVPVIASDAGAIPEVLTGELSGMMVPRTHLHLLAQRIDEWLASPGETRTASTQLARDHVCQHYSPAAEERRLDRILAQLVTTFGIGSLENGENQDSTGHR